MATYVEAMQYTGDVEAVTEFYKAHCNPNIDRSNRSPFLADIERGTLERRIAFWSEKLQAYCTINVGDYIVVDADGCGMSPESGQQFQKTHVPWDGITHHGIS